MVHVIVLFVSVLDVISSTVQVGARDGCSVRTSAMARDCVVEVELVVPFVLERSVEVARQVLALDRWLLVRRRRLLVVSLLFGSCIRHWSDLQVRGRSRF